MALEGRHIVIGIEEEVGGTPEFRVLASQRDLTLNRTADRIDVSDKDSKDRKFLTGSNDQSIETSAWFVRSDVAYNRLELAYSTGQPVVVARFELGSLHSSARAVVTNLTERHPVSGGSEVTVGLAIDGSFTAA
ncbi:MAG: hypothetical protein A3E78_14195 [Alphaproteobacteria bacterium RIFCSPHIGHO2_12_FULL_63_12]|nr:MAG: hypothetical protein A3E78_14195 [Alphaproteobacteria bacterium RIFCSPHIGHO2_12_FULL_63_12]